MRTLNLRLATPLVCQLVLFCEPYSSVVCCTLSSISYIESSIKEMPLPQRLPRNQRETRQNQTVGRQSSPREIPEMQGATSTAPIYIDLDTDTGNNTQVNFLGRGRGRGRCNSLSCPPGQLAPRGASCPGISCPPPWLSSPPGGKLSRPVYLAPRQHK